MPRPHLPRWAAGLLLAAPLPAVGAADPLSFNRDVRPILTEHCFACHGPDAAARKAKLRLDDRQAAVDKGALVPGDADGSELVERLFRADDDEQRMPPPSSHKQLTAEQKAVLKRWVAEGANYQPHWSFIPLVRPAVPAVKSPGWVRSPVDAFVLAGLEAKGLAPAPAADKRTLARRWSLDLVGLPPQPAAVAAYLADTSPGADERYIDALLASPHWGEHRGRYWLDAARYADTHGVHFDNYREVWAYRDWVFRAFNQNLPFDRFTREQLAGDLLPNPTLDQRVATGFVRNNITTNEGGAIDEEYLVLYARDRTETASQVWLGLTTGCAVCHDHKYDPVSQKEFYQLAAFFNNTTQRAMDGNVKDTPPTVLVPADADRPRWATLEGELKAAGGKLDARRAAAKPQFEAWLADAQPAAVLLDRPADGLVFAAGLDAGAGKPATATAGNTPRTLDLPASAEWKPGPFNTQAVTLKPAEGTVSVPDAGDFEADKPFTAAAWVRAPNRGQYAALLARMDIPGGHRGWDLFLDNDRVSAHLIHRWPADAVKVTSKKVVNPNDWLHVAAVWDGSRKPTGLRLFVNGEPQALDVSVNGRVRPPGELAGLTAPAGTTRTAVPLTVGRRTPGDALRQVGVQDVRLFDRMLADDEVARLFRAVPAAAAVKKPAAKRTPAEVAAAFDWYLSTRDDEYRALVASQAALRAEELLVRGRGTVASVAHEKPTPAEAFVLFRGEYTQRRDKVGPGTPAVLPPLPADAPRNRLGLADWLLRPDHPLTARVTVNRFWQELFGTGLVRSSGDFGVSGEPPSHPELLDWLATDFARDWDVKRFFRQLVLSATYRQAAVATPEKLERDRDNRLFSRGPRFRMDAEMVRDYALSASGLLVNKLGGPSVRPYQPDGVWEAVAMPESNTRFYKRDGGESLYRRSVYTFWKRAAPPASLDILNAPNRETCAVRRERTNTPLQALVTLNDVQFVEAARHLATAVLRAKADTPGRLAELAERLLARPLTEPERAVAAGVLERLLRHYADQPAEAAKLVAFGESKPDGSLPAAELAAWTMLANQMLNLDEVLNK